jgi:hypothetical protein
MPLWRTTRMPVSAARFGIAGRPPFGRGLDGGRRGATSAHRAAETRGLARIRQTSPPNRGSRFGSAL